MKNKIKYIAFGLFMFIAFFVNAQTLVDTYIAEWDNATNQLKWYKQTVELDSNGDISPQIGDSSFRNDVSYTETTAPADGATIGGELYVFTTNNSDNSSPSTQTITLPSGLTIEHGLYMSVSYSINIEDPDLQQSSIVIPGDVTVNGFLTIYAQNIDFTGSLTLPDPHGFITIGNVDYTHNNIRFNKVDIAALPSSYQGSIFLYDNITVYGSGLSSNLNGIRVDNTNTLKYSGNNNSIVIAENGHEINVNISNIWYSLDDAVNGIKDRDNLKYFVQNSDIHDLTIGHLNDYIATTDYYWDTPINITGDFIIEWNGIDTRFHLDATTLDCQNFILKTNLFKLENNSTVTVNGNLEIYDYIQNPVVGRELSKAGQLYIDGGSVVNVTGTITTQANGADYGITINSNGVLNSSDVVTINGRVQLLSDANGIGYLKSSSTFAGTGEVDRNYYLNGGANSGESSNGEYWREIYISSSQAISAVTWGSTYNTKVQGVQNSSGDAASTTSESYINYFDATDQTWKLPLASDIVNTKSFQVFQKSGESIQSTSSPNALNQNNFNLIASDADGSTDDLNFLGNPFLTNFALGTELASGGALNASVKGNVAYVYTEYSPGYIAYRTVGAGGNYGYDNIPLGQAFWVNSLVTSLSGNYSTSSSVYTAANKLNKTSVATNELRIELLEGVVAHDYLYFKFNNTLDGNFNAITLNTSADKSPNGYIPLNSQKLIHKEYLLTDLNSEIREQYYVVGSESKSLSISIANNTLTSGSTVYVHDRKNNQTYNISTSAYSFTHDPSYDQSVNSRFEIIISDQPLANGDLLYEKVRMLKEDDYIEFKLPANIEIDHIDIYSISGNKMKVESNSNNIYKINNYTEGVYILNAIFKDGASKTFKFIK
jgi:hypothetical protein